MATKTAALWGLFVLLFGGCDAEIYHGLRERQANQAIVALREAGLRADKRQEARVGNRPATFLLVVPMSEELPALHLLGERGLPRTPDEPVGRGGSLLPFPGEQREQQAAALQERLQETLEGLPQVEEARVQLALPDDDVALPGGQLRPTAAVLLRLRGAAPRAGDIQQLVARAVPGLDPLDVAVLDVPATQAAQSTVAPRYVRVGPLLVAPGSQRLAGGLLALVLLLGAALCASLAYILRARAAPPDTNRT